MPGADGTGSGKAGGRVSGLCGAVGCVCNSFPGISLFPFLSPNAAVVQAYVQSLA
ncbi:hypothetical protein CE91St56_16490 [Lachnospiraceae bacterium]|nr:hypothetical protein CE91St56_16490 [Lachnospiraceae bacterium]GKH40593.1 hypothetical protein CE91St57_15670 [Lachnospiraceae bacterium]